MKKAAVILVIILIAYIIFKRGKSAISTGSTSDFSNINAAL